jgi:hypoxanthine phosphoribosyltransferase
LRSAGGVMFLPGWCEMNCSPSIFPVSGLSTGCRAARRKEHALVHYPLACSIEGMDLRVIDDITDTGETLSTAVRYLYQIRPAQIRAGVLHHTLFPGFTLTIMMRFSVTGVG